jgi:hypothetical protein
MRLHAFAVLGLASCSAATPAVRPGGSQATAIAPDLAKINDGKTWTVLNGDAIAATEDGRSVVRLAPRGGNRKGSNVGLALLAGVDFVEGTIEVDLEGNGSAQASFLGVAFGTSDGTSYEAVYFRPFNFQAEDALHRGHAVQYIAWPEHTWEKLRTQTPGAYEAAVDPVPDPARWFHARIEVAHKSVRVFVDGATKPCLVVDRLGGADKGRVGLWVDSQQGAFANLKLVPTR